MSSDLYIRIQLCDSTDQMRSDQISESIWLKFVNRDALFHHPSCNIWDGVYHFCLVQEPITQCI